MINQSVDVLIVGGGLTGATLLLALKDLGLRVLLIDAKPFTDGDKSGHFDARTLALAPASKTILSVLGLWDSLADKALPIEKIHVSQQHCFGASRLQAQVLKPLGYVLEMESINKALWQAIDKSQVVAPATLTALDSKQGLAKVVTAEGSITFQAKLIVAADGTDSKLRDLCGLSLEIKNYNQSALVANIGLSRSHQGVAYERFTREGPLALLPLTESRVAMVWAMSPERARDYMHLESSALLAKIQKAFGYRLGLFTQLGKPHSYPLQQSLMLEQIQGTVVFVGNAAHTLHPVAGQGFNLGLRDVATLAECIAKFGLNAAMLETYLQLRRKDQQAIIGFTQGLINVFTSRIPGLSLACSLGLVAFDNLPFLKNQLAGYAQGYGGNVPDLACGLRLHPQEIL